MKKLLLAILLLSVMVGTVYSGLSWTGKLTKSIKTPVTVPGVASETLALMPEADVVVLVDVSQILNTKLFSMINNDAKASAEFKKFEAEARKFGVDIRQLRQVAIGARSVDNQQKNGFAIISGSFDRERILAGIAAHPDKVSIDSSEYNGKTVYTIIDKSKAANQIKGLGNVSVNLDKVGMAFLNGQTVVVGDLEGVKKTIDVQAGKLPSVLTNQQMASYLTSTNASAMIRFAGLVPEKRTPTSTKIEPGSKPKVLSNEDIGAPPAGANTAKSDDDDNTGPGGMAKMLETVRGAYGSLDFATGVQLDTTLLIRSDNEAKQMSDSLNGLLALGKGMLGQDAKQAKLLEAINHVTVAGTGRDVKITIDLSEQLLNELINMAKQEQQKSTQRAN